MNGEIEQMSSIVCCARKALCENKDIAFTSGEFILSVKFVFSSPFVLLRGTEADSVQKWYNVCKRRGLTDIKFFVPDSTDSILFRAFANTSGGVIVCFWKNGKSSAFVPTWNFDERSKSWNVVYTEQRNVKLQKDGVIFTNKTEEFKSVLLEISAFADKIGFPYYSGVFNKAYGVLCGFCAAEDCGVPEYVPDEFKGIYYAVSNADVFGAMGSWTDSPSYCAEAMGLLQEYNSISSRLLKQLNYSLMYVVNQSWIKV